MADRKGGGNASPAAFNPGTNAFSPHGVSGQSANTNSGARKPALTLQTSSNAHVDVKSADSKPMRPAVPLYSPGIWSPGNQDAIKSAGLPQRPSWDQLNGTPARVPGPLSGQLNSLPGLGLSTSSNNLGQRGGELASINGNLGGVHFTQTEEYHNSNNKGSFAMTQYQGASAKSDPLPQHPFSAPRENTGGSSNESNSSMRSTFPDTPNTATSREPSTAARADDLQSVSSGPNAFSEHFTFPRPDQVDGKAEVWTERPHTNGLRRALKDPHADWEEAYPGALTVLTAVNPEHFQMPLGTRVINIKTEFGSNVICSIRYGRYSCMEKVSQRIMKVWESRSDPSEKVLFLVSVNGGKRYSGIAEMSGPWDPSADVSAWQLNPESRPCVGSIPVTYIYAKDVSYHHFAHITQEHNGNPVGNMWNGMLFPHNTGRLVIEQYVRTPATTSALGHPKNCSENLGMLPLRGYEAGSFSNRRNTFSRGARGGARGGFRGGGTPGASGRPSSSGNASDNNDIGDATPMASRMVGSFGDNNLGPPRCDLSLAEQKRLLPGQVASVTVDSVGNLVFLPSSNPSSVQGGSFSASDQGSSNASEQLGAHALRGQNTRAQGSFNGASRSFTSPKEFFKASGHPQAGLQHSTSMGILRSGTEDSELNSGGPVLPTSASMGSFRRAVVSNNRSIGQGSDSAAAPHLQPTPGRSAEGIGRTPTSGAFPRSVEDTPTHRPTSHSARGAVQGNAPAKYLPHLARTDEEKNISHLKVQWHQLCAEKYLLQDEAQDPTLSSTSGRILGAKISRVLVDIRAIELELENRGIHQQEPFSQAITSKTGNIGFNNWKSEVSPVRAVDSRVLYGASQTGSPFTDQFSDNESFVSQLDYQDDQRARHGSANPWELRVKSIRDLVASPEGDRDASTETRLGNEPSKFFADGKQGQNNFNIHRASNGHATGQPRIKPAANYSFHGPGEVASVPGNGPPGGVRLD